jgi:hypothetical protein
VSSVVTPSKTDEPQILVGKPASRSGGALVDTRDMHVPALWFGIALAVVTLANFGLLWWRPSFGNAEWEFSTIGQTIDRIPLLVVSMALIVYGALQSGSVRGTRAVAILLVLLALWIIGSTVLYGMASLVAFKLVPGNQLSVVRRTVAKNLFGSIVYTVLFGVTAIQLWRRTRTIRR